MLIVQKFGGSSLADLERLRRAAGICADARRKGHDTVVVVSAMGDSTDDLMDIAHRISPSPSPRELDALLCCGEQKSAALMAIMLQSMGIDALSFTGWQAGISTDLRHGAAEILSIEPKRLLSAIGGGFAAVVSGFQGLDAAGDQSTLGRGGSDTSAVALAAAMGAARCDIYTDVAGIFTADPRLIKGARLLRRVDFRDMLLLSRSGSQVLHERSVELAMKKALPLRLLSTFEEGEGSALAFLPEAERPPIAGITRSRQQGLISVVGRDAGEELSRELCALLSEAGISAAPAGLTEGRLSLRPEESRLYDAMQLVHDRLFP